MLCKHCGVIYEDEFGNTCPICGSHNCEAGKINNNEGNKDYYGAESTIKAHRLVFKRNQLLVAVAIMCAIVASIFACLFSYINHLKEKEAELREIFEARAYNSGIKAIKENKDYDLAIEELSKISPDNKLLYPKAVEAINESYIGKFLRRAEELMKTCEYVAAISFLNTAIDRYGTDYVPELVAKRAECYKAIKTMALNNAEKAYSNGQLSEAIMTLKAAEETLQDDDLMIKVLLQEYIGEYKEYILNKVNDMISSNPYKMYLQGIEELDKALEITGSDESLLCKKNELLEYEPAPLSDIFCSESHYVKEIEKGTTVTDRLGNTFFLTTKSYKMDFWDSPRIVFHLAGKYRKLQCTLAPSEFSDQYGFSVSKKTINIYFCDAVTGEILGEYQVNALTEPFEVTVTIPSGTMSLEIRTQPNKNPEGPTCVIMLINPLVYIR